MTGKRKLLLAGFAAVVVIGVAVFVLPPMQEGETQVAAVEPAQSAAALTVVATTPERDIWPVEVRANGWLAAWQEVVISAQVGGQMIEAVNADVGDVVAQGDVLTQFSRGSLENDILQLEASLESARASLEIATADADRARKLSGGSAISKQQAAEYLSTERKAEADISFAEAQLASARLDLDHTEVTAVTGGVVSSRSAAVGDVVTSGEELFRLVRDGRVEWQAEVPLKQLRNIEIGTPVSVPTPLGEISGEVRRIAPSVSESNGRVIVYVSLKPPEEAVQPKTGIMITGVFRVGESEALSVPSSAVVMQDGFSYVFALEQGDVTTVSRLRVETGRRRDDQVEIVSGLSASDDVQIVQSGGAFLSDGSIVAVAEADTAVDPDADDTTVAETDQ
ncbi:efflux RND transporter periplasmic adaptor subunit [Sulfitobacter sp. BDSS02]|nr:efflux RND transporter periplasmic adaptor subunit [Sulfitobacter sp. BDSS02]MBR9849923.1 efflux RND transporter periplasmic adaptor subunit [Paracoccaceae bacterium]